MNLWVVEMLIDRKWEPTVGVALTRNAARDVMREWKRNNPGSRFALAKYDRARS